MTVKYDTGKPRVGHLLDIFARSMLEIAKCNDHGMTKYDDLNWRTVPDGIRRFRDAKARHMLAASLETHDEETGLLHDAQEIWNALARLELKLEEKHHGQGQNHEDEDEAPAQGETRESGFQARARARQEKCRSGED